MKAISSVGPRLLAAACAALFLLPLFWACGDRVLAGQNDFLQLYGGAQLVGTGDLYSPEAMKGIQTENTGVWLRGVYYSRLPFYAFLLKPLGWLPYPAAYAVFQALSATALAGFLWLYLPRCPDLLFFTGASAAVMANFVAGQDVAITLFLVAFSLTLSRRNRDFAAGLVLAGCAIKFHLFALVPIAVVMHRRWHTLAGGAAGGAGILALSFLADGWDWPLRYLGQLRNPELHPGATNMPNLHGMLANLHVENVVLEVLLAVLVAVAVAVAGHRVDYERAVAIALVGGLLTSHHAYMQDCTLLLLVLVMFASGTGALRALSALAVIAPVPLIIVLDPPAKAVAPLVLIVLLVAAVLASREPRTRAGDVAEALGHVEVV